MKFEICMRIVVALIEAILKVLEKSKESKKTDDSDKFVINDLAYRLNGIKDCAAFCSASKSQEKDAICDADSKKEEDDDPKPEFIGLDIPLIMFT